MDWPPLFDSLWCVQPCGAVGSHQTRRHNGDTVHLSYWSHHREQVGRCTGMQEKPALFQALRNRREGFLVIPPVIFTPPRGPEPTPSSNKPSGSESNISIRGGGGRGGRKKKASTCWSALRDQQRASTRSVTTWCCSSDLVNHFVQSRRPASASSGSSQLGSLSASQTLREVFKCAPAAMRSLNDLFIC